VEQQQLYTDHLKRGLANSPRLPVGPAWDPMQSACAHKEIPWPPPNCTLRSGATLASPSADVAEPGGSYSDRRRQGVDKGNACRSRVLRHGKRVMIQTWKHGPSDDFTCPHCGAVYAVTIRRFPMRDSDREDCIECKRTMLTWNDTSVPSFRLKRRADVPTSSRLRGLRCA
jgi:hypothetical protein